MSSKPPTPWSASKKVGLSESASTLARTLDTLPGIGPKRASMLAGMGVRTLRDLLFYWPKGYQDRRAVTSIASLSPGDLATVEAEIVDTRVRYLRRRMALTQVTLRDDSGQLAATWFGPAYLSKAFTIGARGFFHGRVADRKGLTLQSPEYELLSGDNEEDRLHTGRIVPMYRLTEGVTQRLLRRWVHTALEAIDDTLEESLPKALRTRHGFPAIAEALWAAHFPDAIEAAESARRRFVYEELLGMQLGILKVRGARERDQSGTQHVTDGPLLAALRDSLPFTLTDAQRRAIEDILGDMAAPRPMHRLLQGDVGCGKTLVALHAVAAAADGGYQVAVLAPTEILAEQHARTLREHLEPLGLYVELLTRSTAKASRVRTRLLSGESPIVVGTHTLVQEKLEFRRLGLAIIDEQHRFGVLQRSALAAKGQRPDLLHMTATPIPRTLAITLYGGMDISTIDELPPGRTPVKTAYIPEHKVPGLYDYIRKQSARGFQTYIVCPLVEESDAMELKAVTQHFESMTLGPLKGLRAELLHGRMAGPEKEEIMRRFKRGQFDVLVSTSVIEVGIDVPTATTMVIEDAGQFGLTQLHQLRGRVGRGSEQSYCFLLGKPKTDDARKRIEILCRTTDGFVIAEEDLNLRGPGELVGIRQAGLDDLHFVDLLKDARLLDSARRDALAILQGDPDLIKPMHRRLGLAAERFERLNA